ncbi:MAG TPA: tRNA pseudouridine(38-40) synthase TruA [Candidatus Acidoferrum sp.]|nr:tRNA pseudouridine(38-40) synthase TruA [Candidatus Acidoferrum sp.]
MSRKIVRFAGPAARRPSREAGLCAPPSDSNARWLMRHFKLTIAYDGTDFHGWQIQANKPTIQGEIVNVLQRVTEEKIFLHGAGRTDAGVHALGQVASFHTHSGLSAEEFQRALNALLPPTIRIVGSEEVGPDFHARWSACRKTYRYRLYREKVVPPMLWRFVLHYPFPLNEDAMRDAAARFVGIHDFASFAASTGSEDDDKERSTEREIYSSELARTSDNEELVFTVTGRSFLRYMVRKMVGTLLEVGRGKLTPEDIERLYELKDRSKSGPTVPPQGLVMVEVQHLEAWRVGKP